MRHACCGVCSASGVGTRAEGTRGLPYLPWRAQPSLVSYRRAGEVARRRPEAWMPIAGQEGVSSLTEWRPDRDRYPAGQDGGCVGRGAATSGCRRWACGWARSPRVAVSAGRSPPAYRRICPTALGDQPGRRTNQDDCEDTRNRWIADKQASSQISAPECESDTRASCVRRKSMGLSLSTADETHGTAPRRRRPSDDNEVSSNCL